MEKKAVILGFGKSGQSAGSFLLDAGYAVFALDKNASSLKNSETVVKLLEKGLILQEEDEPLSFEDAEFVVKSPGIFPNHSLVQKAQELTKIVDEIDIGTKILSEKGKKLFAITGSNGKTTTASLVFHVMQASGLKVAACGNIGTPLLEEVQKKDLADFYIVELSSFQLWAMKGKYFDAGIFLNLSPNHLDWHGTFSDYANAKWSLQEKIKKEGLFFPPGSFERGIEERVESILSLRYRGAMGCALENVKAAFTLCKIAGIPDDAFWKAFETFKKPPHRLEFVKEHDGVIFINDSKATTIKAVEHAISACDAPVILIAGGIHKGDDFQKWIPLCREKVKKVFAIGRDKEKIACALESIAEVEMVSDLPQAVKKAIKIASRGDTVLLSPGCASYDAFRSYEHRGEVFKSIVYSECASIGEGINKG